jgi:hypothetical protein
LRAGGECRKFNSSKLKSLSRKTGRAIGTSPIGVGLTTAIEWQQREHQNHKDEIESLVHKRSFPDEIGALKNAWWAREKKKQRVRPGIG